MPRKSKAKKNLIKKALRMRTILQSRKQSVSFEIDANTENLSQSLPSLPQKPNDDDNANACMDTNETDPSTYELTSLPSLPQKPIDDDNANACMDANESDLSTDEVTNFPSSSNIINDIQSKDANDTDPPADESTMSGSPHDFRRIEGRRIVNIGYFYSKLQDIAKHGSMDCGLTCVEIVGERKNGLCSQFTLKCLMCNEIFHIDNDSPDELNINDSAVAGTIAIGCGHSQLQELTASLNLPVMSYNIYKTCHSKLFSHWEKLSVVSMNAAAEKERKAAIAEGRVDINGIPIIDVIIDGCWSKRTYKKNYSALSGAAAIIGKRTGEVLFLGVKNKYCSVCAQAEKKHEEPKQHKCFKNYNGPSTAMESEILVEGFKRSIEMHNLIYGRIISDGDSSTYSKLLKSRPYPHISIEKIECRNHLLRNLCNKLTAYKTDTKFLLKFRKEITQKRILILRKTIRKIINAYTSQSEFEKRRNIELMHHDILLSHLHAFGDHSRCKSIFCDVVNGETTKVIPEFFTSSLWSRICTLMSNLASHTPSLIHNVDSNTVERFNSIVAKLVGGKRINFSKRGSYMMRCHAAVVSFNTHKVLSSIHKSIVGRSPRGSIRKLENRRLKTMTKVRKFIRKKNRMLFSKGEDLNYGNTCEKPDMEPNMFQKAKNTFLENLVKNQEDKERIERETVLQSSCSEWLELRRNILTASNFGKVVKRRDDISCHNLVKDIIYKDCLGHIKSIKHGKDNEERALRQLEVQEGIKIKPCGLFIDDNVNFLGATPDGIIDDETIVEMKCPLNVYGKNCDDVIKSKKMPFYKLDKEDQLIINKTHNWYYQIQGQLHISKRNKCLFAIWSGENHKLKTHMIFKDDDLWNQFMEPKLVKFYTECMLPELVDPRIPRNMAIRDPDYIKMAISKKEDRRKLKRKYAECLDLDKENILSFPEVTLPTGQAISGLNLQSVENHLPKTEECKPPNVREMKRRVLKFEEL